MKILDGREISKEIYKQIEKDIDDLRGYKTKPGLTVRFTLLAADHLMLAVSSKLPQLFKYLT